VTAHTIASYTSIGLSMTQGTASSISCPATIGEVDGAAARCGPDGGSQGADGVARVTVIYGVATAAW